MSCSPAVMYSACRPDISETSKSEPVYALLSIISSEHTQQRNLLHLHTAGSCSSLSECSLGIRSMFSILLLTVNVHHKEPQQVMDISLFLVALYLL